MARKTKNTDWPLFEQVGEIDRLASFTQPVSLSIAVPTYLSNTVLELAIILISDTTLS